MDASVTSVPLSYGGNRQRLVQSLHRLTLVYLWMKLKPNFYNPNHCNYWYSLDTSMAFSLFGLIVKINLKSSQMTLIVSIITLNLPMNPVKRNDTFLDLIVKLSKGSLTTDLHIRDTDRHQYFYFNSSHPDHTKRSIIYS